MFGHQQAFRPSVTQLHILTVCTARRLRNLAKAPEVCGLAGRVEVVRLRQKNDIPMLGYVPKGLENTYKVAARSNLHPR